jgi:hypothetical protein
MCFFSFPLDINTHPWAGYIPTEASYGIYSMADGFCHADSAVTGAVLTGYVNVTSGNQSALQVRGWSYKCPVFVFCSLTSELILL